MREARDRRGVAGSPGAGDVDRDGYADLFVGAWGDDDRDQDAGAAHLALGTGW